MNTTQKKPGLFLSLLPVITLVVLISLSVRLFGDDVTAGASQISLFIAAIAVCLTAILYLKVPWENIEKAIMQQLDNTGGAIFILLMIGALSGSWMQSGIVPSMIYYGLKIIHPSVFLPIVFLLCSVISFIIGSSWTTVGTFGIAMLSAGNMLGIPVPWLAGAIISGSYFGDKMSFLSDTTNLASSICGVPLHTHVKYMLVNTLPVFILCIVIYAVANFFIPIGNNLNIQEQVNALSSTFRISGWLLLVPVFTLFLIIKKISPLITLFVSALIGAIIAVIFQAPVCEAIAPQAGNAFTASATAFFKMLSGSVSIETGNAMLNTLTATKGMAGMLNTVWLILCVVCFGGAMTASGMIQTITGSLIKVMRNTFSLVGTTLGTSIFLNCTLSDQYMAIVIPGKMFSEVYREKGYAPELLSRSLEESATVTSVLVPWNTCAVAQSSVLGVATLSYLPYCFFNLITPLFSLFAAAVNYKIRRIRPDKK